MKELGKEVKKSAAAINAVRADFYRLKKWQSAAVLVAAAAMVAGLALQYFSFSRAAEIAGLVIIIVAAAFVFGAYLVIRSKGPLNYSAYFLRRNGEEYTLVAISKKHFRFTAKGETVEFFRGETTRTPAADGVRWDWFLSAEFLSSAPSNGGIKYVCGYGGKRAVLLVRAGRPDYAEAGGLRMRYRDVNALYGKVGVPRAFYDECVKLAGGDVPFFAPRGDK